MQTQNNSYPYSYEQEVEMSPLLADQEPPNFDLDLSRITQSTDNSLPAIIITPCRPTNPFDYEIAFLATKDDYMVEGAGPWSLQHPLASFLKISRNSSRRTRIAFGVALPATVIGVHLLINHYLTGRSTNVVESWPIPFWG